MFSKPTMDNQIESDTDSASQNSLSDSDDEEIPIQLNYIWIGPPPVAMEATDPAIDTYGPQEMAKAAKQSNTDYQVNFWCLHNQIQYYQEAFKGSTIEVKSIENFLKDASDHPPIMLKKLNEMKNTILTDDRNRNRDRVTFKCLFSLFLLAVKGDYVLDTNIRPIKNNHDKFNLNLQRHPEFRIPALNEVVENAEDTDCWMMYAPNETYYPIKNIIRPPAELAFELYYQKWKFGAESIFALEGYSKEYHETLGDSIVDSVYKAARNQQKRFLSQPFVPKIIFWRATSFNKAAGLVSLEQLGVEKLYYNTHWNFEVAPAAKKIKLDQEENGIKNLPQDNKNIFLKNNTQSASPSSVSNTIDNDNNFKKRKR
jgi:hypothetical protein